MLVLNRKLGNGYYSHNNSYVKRMFNEKLG